MVQEIFPPRLIKFTSFHVPDISTKEEKNHAKHRVWVLVDLYNNTLAKIITINNAHQDPHREELKETYNCGCYHLSKESQRKAWPY